MCEPGQADPPIVTVWPADGTYTAADSLVAIAITWFSGEALASNTREILLNGIDVTGQFTYSGGTQSAESYGTVRLAPGTNYFSARICDTGGQCTTVPRQYTYVPLPALVLPRLHGVQVTPDQTSGVLAPGATGQYTFTATNKGDTTGVFLADAVCSGAFTACSRSPTSLQLAPGQSGAFHLSITAGAAGGLVTGRLTARHQVHTAVHAEGRAEVAVTVAPGPTIPVVSVAEVNPGTMIARSGCVTVGLGGDAAYECGDLRIVHPLPATRTLNRTRAPMLVYNHQHARPFPIIQADVRLPAGASVPTMVEAVLQVPTVGTTYTRTWSGSEWTTGETRRIGVPVEGLWLNTGFHPYTLEVTFWYGSTPYRAAPISGEYAVVSRRHSPFGSGWWLAGLEWIQTQPPDWSTLIWVGGDGSTRRFSPRPGYANQWLSEVFDGPPDTLSLQQSPVEFRRSVRGGGSVYYDAGGNHIRTVDRLGRTTTFNYALVNHVWRLTEIVLPVASGTAPKYVFSYDASGRLSTVTSPAASLVPGGPLVPRVTQLTPTGATRDVVGITDPDGHSVAFGYHPGVAHRIASRTDRRGTSMQFGFGSLGRFTDSHRDLQDGTVITHLFDPQESRGVFWSTNAHDTHTFIDGPRTDVVDHTRIWVNRWGAPTRIRDALGNETHVYRENATFPGLVTRTVAPNGLARTAHHDALARLDSTVVLNGLGDGRRAVTRYRYTDTTWPRFPTHVISPERDSVVIGYDAAGNRAWQQDGRGAATRVDYRYYAGTGLLRAAQSPSHRAANVPGDSLVYDSIGNLHRARTARGFWTTYHGDAVGRDTLVLSPVDTTANPRLQQTRTVYDVMDRIQRVENLGPQMDTVPARLVTVQKAYDAEGNLESLSRSTSPDLGFIATITTAFEYDRANRQIVEIAPDGARDSTFYDRGGNVTRARTRRGYSVHMQYDVLNRLSLRRTETVAYAADSTGMPTYLKAYTNLGDNTDYPRYPSDAQGRFVIQADTALFTYDAMGNVLTANNGDARISRTYHPNGLLRTDTARVRTWAGQDFGQHVYGIAHQYDLNGRRTRLHHPAQLSPFYGGAYRTFNQYAYHSSTGALSLVADPLGHLFRYTYNADGQVDTLYMPRGLYETYQYDADGQVRQHRVDDPGWGALRNASFRYDAQGRILEMANQHGFQDTLRSRYSGLGQLVWAERVAHAIAKPSNSKIRTRNVTEFVTDGLGNRTWEYEQDWLFVDGKQEEWTTNRHRTRYESGTGRLRAVEVVNPPTRVDTTRYDPAGNVVHGMQSAAAFNSPLRDRVSYYGADGKLRAVDYRSYADRNSFSAPYTRTFEDYRYDALGRRVLVRARRHCENISQGPEEQCRISTIRRTVWDGDQELYEIQVPGADTDSPATIENDTQPVQRSLLPLLLDPNPFFGRVAYTHGLKLDRPLSVTRINYVDLPYQGTHHVWAPFTIVPLWNWRGDMDEAFIAESGAKHCIATNRCAKIEVPLAWKPFGRQSRNPFTFQGSLLDDRADFSGLGYKRNRYYDPATGRFTQEDPIGLAGGLNLYGYANGDPVNFYDPFGLVAIPLAIPVAKVVIGAAARRYAAQQATRAVAALAVSAAASEAGEIPTEIPASGPRVTRTEGEQIQEMGDAHGCHECGATEPGGSGRWVGDHQEPTALNPPGNPQVLKPHCRRCSNIQGGRVSQEVRRRRGDRYRPENQ